MSFTLFSTFNLILSTTGMTGQDGHKTYEFYQLARLVAHFLLLCLQMMQFTIFWGGTWSSCQLLWLVIVVAKCLTFTLIAPFWQLVRLVLPVAL